MMKTEQLKYQEVPNDVALHIHNAIHDRGIVNVKLPNENGVTIPYIISRASNGCRQLVYNNVKFMEQNTGKQGKYAELAKKGHKITWGMRGSKWIYIIDGHIS